jgi:hypothetical protein
MSKQNTRSSTWEPPIDQAYESRVNSLAAIDGHVSDLPGDFHPPETLRPQRQALVLPERPQSHAIVTAEESALIGQSQSMVGQLMQWAAPTQADTTHTRQTDTAVSVDVGSIVASIPMLLMFLPITGGLVILLYLTVGGPGGMWATGWLVLWGALGLATLIYNRRIGLHHSSTGLGHHALDVQETEITEKYATARYAINRTFEFIEKQRSLTDERNNQR